MIKDITYKITENLDDKDIINLSLINKYHNKILNEEEYWRRRFFTKFKNILPDEVNIYKENWKKYYFLVNKWLSDDSIIDSIKFSIKKDRCDLLSMIYTKYDRDYKMNFYEFDKNCNILNPQYFCIQNDSIKCYKLYNPKPSSLGDCIDLDSHKILEYLSEYIIEDDLINLFNKGCEICAKILEKHFDKYTSKVINLLFIYKNTISIILEGNNKAFSIFVNRIPYKKLLKYKNKALNMNRLDIIKCLTLYTSII